MKVYKLGRRKHHIQESQVVSPFPAGDYKAGRNRHDSMTDKHDTYITKKIHKRSTALEWSVRKLLKDLNIINGINLTLSSDVDQDT